MIIIIGSSEQTLVLMQVRCDQLYETIECTFYNETLNNMKQPYSDCSSFTRTAVPVCDAANKTILCLQFNFINRSIRCFLQQLLGRMVLGEFGYSKWNVTMSTDVTGGTGIYRTIDQNQDHEDTCIKVFKTIIT